MKSKERPGFNRLSAAIAYATLFAIASAISGPQVISGDALSAAVGGKPDCDTPGVQPHLCPDNPANPNLCPLNLTYDRCQAGMAGNNDELCAGNGNACVDPRCIATATQTTGGTCNSN